MDEHTRRYYLEMMGIQCWQLLDTEKPDSEAGLVANTVQAEADDSHGDRDVTTGPPLNNLNWPRLQADVLHCNKCQLHKTRKQAILGRGNQSAALMVILLSPDMIDDASGQLCDGEAYQLLSKMLGAIDIAIDDVYITSLLKCGVPVKHTVSLNELQQCDEYLKQQIQLIHPEQLLVLGETAARCLLQKDKPLDNLRALINAEERSDSSMSGQYESVPMLVSYSPHELLQQPENKRKAWLDLQHLQKMMQGM